MSESSTPWLTELEMQVWRRWLRAQTEVPAELGRALKEDSELSMQDYETLVHLTEAEDGRLRISVLADTMHWERSRLSHHLRRMVGRGLIAKEECAFDGRGAFVSITEQGRAALAAAAPGHLAAVRRVFFDGATDTELAALDTFLARVLERTGD
ncbi:MarR family winged helix-turn-helix transcriptional regulator [Ornithinimicrobium pratense]|uniref:Winged helix-turn-helix transcriptional regulator n=1 Tax=Ornithinimicrobium pratense TaxID=2593973 RepID=A0A5J6V711_9MICO|nr:MarR family winged helix-turn-helix transcriptional regulator [Ornithinimicrobium pratense]QFG69598.1 winged helix-turn-helix transcriptional regulator [Ornithinimicrobium pratense]